MRKVDHQIPEDKEFFFISTERENTEIILNILKDEIILNCGIFMNRNLKVIREKETKRNLIPISLKSNEKKQAEFYIKILIDKLNQLEIPDFEIVKKKISEEYYNHKMTGNLKTNVADKISTNLMKYVSNSFDIVGNIAIIDMNIQYGAEIDNFMDLKKLVGSTILANHKNITTVLNKKGSISGEFRIRNYEYIVGKKKFIVEHKENDCLFKFDITKMFFSPRLSFERNRITKLNYDIGDKIIDCFSGVGPFSIQIAVKNYVEIISCEKNPDSYEFLVKNIKLNRKKIVGNIVPYLGDFRDLHKNSISDTFLYNTDKIFMNLPENNLAFLPFIKQYVKPEGSLLVIYLILDREKKIEDLDKILKLELKNQDLNVNEIKNRKVVKTYAPGKFLVVYELTIS